MESFEQRDAPGLVYMLLQHVHLVLYPVHPATSAQYRETFYPSGAKSDPSDTALLLELLMHHRDRLRPLQPDTAETRLLQLLVEQRRRIVNEERTRPCRRDGTGGFPQPVWGAC